MKYYQDPFVTIYEGDCREVLTELPPEFVQCVVTSPPYWGLRKYAGEQKLSWNGWQGAYGLEPTPEMYVDHTVEMLRAIRRVLRKDGVVFWNIGDSYSTQAGQGFVPSGGGQGNRWKRDLMENEWQPNRAKIPGLKPKDLCLIPFRVALAAQVDGWWVRSVIIWSKPNPMPESVKDRPTESHEYILMLTKSGKYYWDADAVRESSITGDPRRPYTSKGAWALDGRPERQQHGGEPRNGNDFSGRNIRTVWEFPTQPYPEAHFAVFPTEIPKKCIMAASKEADIILDPFAGSGTVGEVAKSLGRKAILIDTAEEYCELARKRIEAVILPMPSL